MAVHKAHKLPVVPPLCGSGAWSKGTFGPWRGLGNHRNVTGMWILFFWGFYALSSMFISNPLTWSFITFICIYHFLVISSCLMPFIAIVHEMLDVQGHLLHQHLRQAPLLRLYGLTSICKETQIFGFWIAELFVPKSHGKHMETIEETLYVIY